jgi:hypothetical protein
MAKTAKTKTNGLRREHSLPAGPPPKTLGPEALVAEGPDSAASDNSRIGAAVVAGELAEPARAGRVAEPDEGLDRSRRERSTAQAPSTVSPIAWSK